jgi:hypothetical protein
MSIVRKSAIISKTPAADHRESEGYFGVLSAGEFAVSTSASALPYGVIVEGENTDGADTIAICGATSETVHVKLGGTVAEGAYGELQADGTVITDSAAGARIVCCIFLESGVATELVEAALITPVQYS